jgi:O-6-methylguanine DNA methyltransferase
MTRAFFNGGGPELLANAHTLGQKDDSVNGDTHGLRRMVWLGAQERLARSAAASGSAMEVLHSTVVISPVGPLFLAASEKGLVALEFDKRLPGQQTIRPNPRDLRAESMPADRKPGEGGSSMGGRSAGARLQFKESASALRPYTRELEEYFARERREFTFPLDLRGTEFQLACWRALVAIPYGETRTYADIARAVGRPQGFRAVGMANNRNPVAIVVPCHRVIASDGTLCGYGGGLDIKRKLLELEGALSGTLAA